MSDIAKAAIERWLKDPAVREALERRPANRTKSKYSDDDAVADFTRVCEQTGMIEQLRKE